MKNGESIVDLLLFFSVYSRVWGTCKITGEQGAVQMKSKWKILLGGTAVGLLNGLLGSGGGMILVPLLEKLNVTGKSSHATSLAVIVPLSAVSAFLYWRQGWLEMETALPLLLPGLAGGILGGFFMGKIPLGWLKGIFGLLLLWGGVRCFF